MKTFAAKVCKKSYSNEFVTIKCYHEMPLKAIEYDATFLMDPRQLLNRVLFVRHFLKRLLN